MSVTYPIPHTARFIPTENNFVGTFNVPTVGKYDFGIAANTKQDCLELQKNSVYLIERISVGGNVSEEIFNDSIDTTPKLVFRKKQDGQVVYKEPLKISNYYKDTNISTFVWSEIKNDYLTLSLEGVLNQVPATIGVTSINLVISLAVFAVDNNKFNELIRRGITSEFSERLVK